ncbi:MAG: BolA/IbaG family iron-sulfur metabolism protein [Cyanobacteria bacterium P01_F01_bin.150]
MIKPDQVVSLIKSGIPDAEVQVQDLTGTQNHYQVIVISSAFEGKRLIQQHQLVYGTVQSEMASNVIHALSLKTYTPEEWTSQAALS